MPIFELTKDSLVPVATTTFAAEHIRERYDLQRVLRDNIRAIAPEIRKKAAEERLSEGSGVDRTRYELTIADEAFSHQTKRGLIFRVVSALIRLGVTPEQIMEIFPRRKFLTVQGTFTSPEEFANIASNLRSATGATYDLGRFFADKDELFHVAGNTYALSNQWSKGSMPYLERLIARYPQAAISFKAEEEGS